MTDSIVDFTPETATPVSATTESPVVATPSLDATVATSNIAIPASTEARPFTEMFSEEFRNQSNLKDFKSADDLAKSYLSLQRMVGSSVRIPGTDATPEAKQDFYNKLKSIDGVYVRPTNEKEAEEFYAKLGRPSTSDEYKLIDKVEDTFLKEDMRFKNTVSEYQKAFHKIGLTKPQSEALLKVRMAEMQQEQKEYAVDKESGEAQLKQIWGDDYNNRIASIKQIVPILHEKYGNAVNNMLYGANKNNPVLLHVLSELAMSYKEKGHTGLSSSSFGLTPEMAKEKIAERKADRGFTQALYNNRHPSHKSAVEELQKLYAVASPNTGT